MLFSKLFFYILVYVFFHCGKVYLLLRMIDKFISLVYSEWNIFDRAKQILVDIFWVLVAKKIVINF